jgi:serine protease inhibitor
LQLRATWWDPYSESSTQPADFHCTPELVREVPMMLKGGMFAYAEDELAQVVRHRAEGLDVLFLLPREAVGVALLERRPVEGLVDRYRSALELELGTVRLPRFDFECSFDLLPALRELGVSAALDSRRAQLFGTSADAELVFARQRNRLAIHEKGISAGSVTTFAGRVGGRMGKPPFEFTANRPFLIVVRHEQTGAILFVGRYAGPLK